MNTKHEPTPKMTKSEWVALGTARFGPDMLQWRFVCPICKGEQTAEDFREFKDRGATPDQAYFSCLGRWTHGKRAFGDKVSPETRCDYTLGGLFRLPGVIVVDEGGEERLAFAFAEVE